MIDEMKLSDIAKIINLSNSIDKKELKHDGEEIRIVILQRGWVIIGKFYQDGHNCWVKNGYVIRSWGTERGLGELAMEGIKENTKLDAIPETRFHELTIVASMICDKSKWMNLC